MASVARPGFGEAKEVLKRVSIRQLGSLPVMPEEHHTMG